MRENFAISERYGTGSEQRCASSEARDQRGGSRQIRHGARSIELSLSPVVSIGRRYRAKSKL